jgi:hypothetical protein
MREPCDDCLIVAMCTCLCDKKKWQMKFLREASQNHLREMMKATNRKTAIHYKNLYKIHDRNLNEARRREFRVILRSGKEQSSSGSSSSSSSSSWKSIL